MSLFKKKKKMNTNFTEGFISKCNNVSINPSLYRYTYKYKVFDLWYEIREAKLYSCEVKIGTRVCVCYDCDNPATSYMEF